MWMLLLVIGTAGGVQVQQMGPYASEEACSSMRQSVDGMLRQSPAPVDWQSACVKQ